MPELIHDSLAEAFAAATAVTVLTGAGISQESGIPTFRDKTEGLWARHNPADLATPEAFARDPALVTRWYAWRVQRCAAAKPNAGHIALARIQRRMDETGARFTLVTQNVDRLHQVAGSHGVIELHGSIHDWRCARCGRSAEPPSEDPAGHPPRCGCGGIRRPGVVWFGEPLPQDAIDAAHHAAANCSLFLSIGTSSVVWPAAGLAEVARQHGAKVAEINLDPTPLSERADWSIRAKAGVALPQLARKGFGLAL